MSSLRFSERKTAIRSFGGLFRMHKSLPFAALLVGIVAASFACVKTAVSVDIGLCAMDCLLDACDSARGIPLLWLVCPVLSAFYLGWLWQAREVPVAVVLSGSRVRLAGAQLADAVMVSVAVSLAFIVSLILFGVLLTGGFCNFDATASRFACVNKGLTLEIVPVTEIVATVYLYCAVSQIALFAVFYVVRTFVTTKGAIAILGVLCLPAVHGHDSFIYDVAHNILGGSIIFPNPLSFLFETANVGHASWLPGAGHGLLSLLAMMGILLGFAFLLARRREFL